VAEAPGSRVFISYRREDSGYPAGWLFDQLAASLGADRVFKDVDSIEPGDDFAEVISDAVSSCAVLLAVIGDRWLAAADEDGRRLDDPGDFVRLEIEAALTRGVRVIPVLVGGARMPRPAQLPPSLASLCGPPGDPSQPCPVQIRHRGPAHRAGTGARPGGSPAAARPAGACSDAPGREGGGTAGCRCRPPCIDHLLPGR
jgi:TIR domain